MVETAEKTRLKRVSSFRQRLCQGLELDIENPHVGIISLLQEKGDIATVAIALEDSLIRNQPFNGARPLSPKVLEPRLLSFAVEVVRRSKNTLLPAEVAEAVEDVMLCTVLRLRAVLGASNTRAERDRVSWEYWQRLPTVTTRR